MKRLRSFVEGRWHEADSGFAPLFNPSTEEQIAEASSAGIDFAVALDHARMRGRAALAGMSIAERGELLSSMSKALHARRDELIELSVQNTGATRRDTKFDLDGATFTLSFYGSLGKGLGSRRCFVDGDGARLGRSARFWGQHLLLPLDGAAVHLNAFNFPAWGFAEKAACALLAGMPVITKPATSSALVTERCVEVIAEASMLPEGALALICGSTGDLLERLGPQDVVAFTGSAETARALRVKENLLRSCTRFNIEADSLNAAVLGPDVEPSGETWSVFLTDVVREMTQKTGQKCTAVRRILVPRQRLEEVQAALVERLAEVVTGDPREAAVTMGPLATAQQLRDAVDGVAELERDAQRVLGEGRRIDGVGAPPGKGYFFGPTLLRADDAMQAGRVHDREVFGPVSTLLPFDGSADEAARAVGLGGGSLVTSIYSDDSRFLAGYLARGGSTSGRLYIGSEKVAGQLPGSGVALPQVLHGGPGRAGGGHELGGPGGLELYLQRVALTGDRGLIERLSGLRD